MAKTIHCAGQCYSYPPPVSTITHYSQLSSQHQSGALSLLHSPPDTVFSLVETYYAGAKVYAFSVLLWHAQKGSIIGALMP